MFRNMKLRNKILLPVGLLVLTAFLLMFFLLLSHVDEIFKKNAFLLADEMGHRYAHEVRNAADTALDAARTLVYTFEGMKKGGKIPDREILNGMLRNLLTENENFLGIWTCWEPYTLDGRDDEYINADGHDHSGRYMPVWDRFGADIRLRPLSAFELAIQSRDYMQVRNRGREIISDPQFYSVQGKETAYINLAAPVFYNKKVIAATGILIRLTPFHELVARVRPFERGYISVISNSGIIVSHPLQEIIGHRISEYISEHYRTALVQAVRNGDRFAFFQKGGEGGKGQSYRIQIPFRIGKTETPWSIGITVPMEKVLENSARFRYMAAFIASFLLLGVIAFVFFLSRQIVKPLYRLVNVSQSLADGNFEVRTNLTSKDEFGMAARYIDRAFDIVVEKMYWYEGMLDAIPFPVSVTDMNMRWTFVNKKAEKTVGKTRKEVRGLYCHNRNGKICNTERCGTVLLRKGITSSVFENTENDRYYQIDTAWLRNMQGEKTGHIEIVQDISETRRLKKKADERHWLQSGESNLNHLIRGEQDIDSLGKIIIDFLCKYLNVYAGALYLYDEKTEKLRLRSAYAYKKRKDLSSEFAPGEGLVGQAALEKESILICNVPDDYIHISSALGSAKPRNIIVAPFLFDDEIMGVIELGAFHDFTPLEREFLDNIVRHIGVVINTALSRTRMENLLFRTQTQAEELQVQQEELRQANAELEEQTRALRVSESDLQEQQEELRVINEELEERTQDLEEQRDDVEKKNEALRIAHREIELKARDLEIAGKYKSEFLANMSHELRTPLNSILILSQLLADNKEKNLNRKQQEFAETIHSSGSDLLSLINDILDLSKVEAGKLDMVVEEMNLAELANDVRRTFEQVAVQKGLHLHVETEPNLPLTIQTDVKRVWQILKNLLSNAFKFTEKGGVTLRIFPPDAGTDFQSDLHPDNALAFSVSDTGIGIPKEKQGLIFQAFQQVDGTTSRKYGGTGLGLSISKEFARALGGEIRLESEPDKGSSFTLYLPLRSEGHQKKIPGPEPASPPPAIQDRSTAMPNPEESDHPFVKDDRRKIAKGDKSLLIIEDDPNFCRILLELAHEKNFKVLVAEDGETGLHFADYFHPSGIILDIGLPGIDGWQVMERLKENPETRHIPVHFISVNDNPLVALRMGAVGFITKPVSVEMLDDVFNRIENIVSRPVKKLLIVEDDEVQKKSMMQLIGNGDVESVAADSAQEAFRLLSEEHFDCMILDLGLGDMSGFELLAKIRKNKKFAHIPVIIYTGKDISKDEEKKLQKYADSIIIKGVRSPERLLDETSLFLHRVESELPKNQQQMLLTVHDKEDIFKDKKILIVDDDMRNVFALASVLEEKGMKILEARNGKESLEKLSRHPDTDLVIMDIMMPEMDGYEAIGRIRQDMRLNKLPIIAITAKAMKGDKNKCVEAGANDYLAKPVDTDKLLSLLRVWLY
ncbi:MAG: response regulator [Desulfococcaceae bacterium]|nr:response regulator [Desulfococcaceae bacterium]